MTHRRNRSRTLSVLALISIAAVLPRAASAAGEQAKTIDDLRTIGVAMFRWYEVEMKPRATGGARPAADAITREKTRDLGRIPPIALDELRRLLVPKYLPAIPARDGWGHPYEFRLITQDPHAGYVMTLRSPGSDGRFSGLSYAIGAFPPHRAAEDLVWADGFFVRWPER